MADFRLPLQNSRYEKKQLDAELDWDGAQCRWFRSERDSGLGQSWTEGLDPGNDDLQELSDFFHVDLTRVPTEIALRQSPGELVMRHLRPTAQPAIWAMPCRDCSSHWIVFKWNSNENQWRAYGRTCDFRWRRGEPLDKEELEFFGSVPGPQTERADM